MAIRRKILVVDDDPMLRRLLVDTLKSIGHEVVSAVDGIDAIELLRQHEDFFFDLLVTDVKMPNMDGMALLRRIRRSYPGLPVLFITGIVSEETMAAASPDGYLSKPFRISHLEELIEKTLAEKYSSKRRQPRHRILINIPEADVRENLAETLALSDYIPFAVEGGQEALEELERGKFDAVIAVIDPDSKENDQYLDQLRKAYPNLPVLLARSGSVTTKSSKVDINLHPDGYFELPARIVELLEQLDKTVRASTADSN